MFFPRLINVFFAVIHGTCSPSDFVHSSHVWEVCMPVLYPFSWNKEWWWCRHLIWWTIEGSFFIFLLLVMFPGIWNILILVFCITSNQIRHGYNHIHPCQLVLCIFEDDSPTSLRTITLHILRWFSVCVLILWRESRFKGLMWLG